MVIVTCAYIFLVRPGYMLSSYLLAYGFVLLRLLPLLNQLYGLHGHLAYLAGRHPRSQERGSTRRIFLSARLARPTFAGLSDSLAFEHVSYRYPNGKVGARRYRFAVPVGQTIAIVGLVGCGQIDAGQHPAPPSRARRPDV